MGSPALPPSVSFHLVPFHLVPFHLVPFHLVPFHHSIIVDFGIGIG
jgi:hypothetical protein